MPKDRFFLLEKNGEVHLRSWIEPHKTVRKAKRTKPIQMARITARLMRLNNSYQADVVTLRIINHMKSIGKGDLIRPEHYPVSHRILPTIIRKPS